MKKLVTLITVLVLLTSIAGCGNSETPSSGQQADTQQQSETVQKSETVQSSTQETQDKPLEFSIAMTNGNNEYILKTSDVKNEKWVKEFNSRFNTEMTIKFLNSNNITQDLQLMLASGDITDLVLTNTAITGQPIVKALDAGVFLALDDLINKNKSTIGNIISLIPENSWKSCKYNGKTYAIPSVFLSKSNRRATFIRKDLLDKYKIVTPETIEQFVSVLTVFKENGVKYPYSGRENFDYTDAFFSAYGVSIGGWGLDKDGKLVPDMIRPEMKEALAFHNKLYKDGLIDPECLTTKGSVWDSKLSAGDVGLFTHNANSLANYTTKLQANVPDGKWELIASPQGPGGFRGMPRYSPSVSSLLINKNVKEPERILALANKMLSDESQEFFALGIEGETYSKKDGKVVFEYPTEAIKSSEVLFRSVLLNFVRDDTYNKYLTPYQKGGKELIDWFENVAVKEGIANYGVNLAAPQSLIDNPELKPGGACKLFMEYVSKIFYGQLPADAHDEFVKEYLKRGGDKVIEEVNKLYKEGKIAVY